MSASHYHVSVASPRMRARGRPKAAPMLSRGRKTFTEQPHAKEAGTRTQTL